jgi:hypothetical protein
MSAYEGIIQNNNLGQSSLELILQEERESESRYEEEKGMGAEPATTMTTEETVRDHPENEEEEKEAILLTIQKNLKYYHHHQRNVPKQLDNKKLNLDISASW